MWINHSDQNAYAFGESLNTESLFIMATTNLQNGHLPSPSYKTFFLMAQAFRAVAKGEKLVGTELSA